MRIIFSRKGFDSSSGGNPSPIFPDGRILSIPIPDRHSPIRYKDILWNEYNLGTLVSDLTDGRINASDNAHLDPDINSESISRHSEWRPIFGQSGSAQGHLRKNGIQAGDIFLFFGLFCNVLKTSGKLIWDKRLPLQHVIWGWFQINKLIKVDDCKLSEYNWARYHPHFHRDPDKNNILYIARRYLKLPGMSNVKQPGAGVFHHILKHPGTLL